MPLIHVELFEDDREVVAERKGHTVCVRLCQRTRHVRLISRVWIPAHMRADSDDTRALGIAVAHVRLDKAEIGLDAACFTRGWHALEQDWRWTNGDARIAALGARELAFDVTMSGLYWWDGEKDEVRVA